MANIDQILLAFPPDNHATLSDEKYDEAAKQFLEQLKYMVDEKSTLFVASAPQLVQVRSLELPMQTPGFLRLSLTSPITASRSLGQLHLDTLAH
jgi:hypothetical protein